VPPPDLLADLCAFCNADSLPAVALVTVGKRNRAYEAKDASDHYLTGSGRVAARTAGTRSHVRIVPARRCRITVSMPSNLANGGELGDCGCIPWPSQVLVWP
jgi:hypothetical protein